MPIHDWTRVHAGVWHDFHLGWVAELRKVLNSGSLPSGLHARIQPDETEGGPDEVGEYARKRRSVSIRKDSDDALVALIEIVSPGTKATRAAFHSFVSKASDALARGIHLLVIDLFHPTPFSLLGTHHAIWTGVNNDFVGYVPPSAAPLDVVAYSAGTDLTAYVESASAGELVPDLPLFLTPDSYVNVPMEATYTESFRGTPRHYQQILTD